MIKKNNKTAIHMASARASDNGIVPGQIKTDAESNEITAIPELIKTLEIEDCIVTIDAMGCQKNIAETIVDKGAELFSQDYLKTGIKNPTVDSYETTDGDHGRNDTKLFSHAVRSHRGIENSLHWVLDISFREDKSRIRKGNAPENFAVLRHMALNPLKGESSLKKIIRAKRLKAGRDNNYLAEVLCA